MDVQERAARARQNFLNGCNCPQSVVLAFDDVFAEQGLDPTTVVRMASPFGGGMGRLREVCGAVSGMLMVLGALEGYSDPGDDDAKAELYTHVQELANAFREENGSYLCRDLLGLGEGASSPVPEPRTGDYYAQRPCGDFIASAAAILETYLHD